MRRKWFFAVMIATALLLPAAAPAQKPGWVLRIDEERAINTAVFSPDGRKIVTASDDHTIRIWDVASGRLLHTMADSDEVRSAVFSPDGRKIVTASSDNTARIWDTASGKLLHILPVDSGGVSTAAFSPNGREIVTAGGDGTVRVWDTASGKILRTLSGHTDWINAAEFSPDGKRIVTASFDRTARVWDAVSGKELNILGGDTGEVTSALFSPDGKIIATASSDHTARIWDAASGKLLHILPGNNDASPSGSEGILGEVKDIILGHTGEVTSAVFSPDGRQIVTASMDGTARIWDVASGNLLHNLSEHADGVRTASIRAGSRQCRRSLTCPAFLQAGLGSEPGRSAA